MKYDFGNLELAQDENLQESIYKMAAHSEILNINQIRPRELGLKEKEDISTFYQVLVEQTAMVGVIEEINEATGELKKYELDAAAEN